MTPPEGAPAAPTLLATLAFGYLLGAVPFGLLIGRLARGIDLRRHGSGRIGTTNALRTLGPAAAASVLALDLAKGLVAVLATRLLVGVVAGGPEAEVVEWAAATAGVSAVLGHVFSIFIGFRGGRGVATTTGALLGMAPLAVALVAPPALALMWLSRYVSLGSIVGALAAPVVTAILVVADLASVASLAYAAAASAVVVVAHRDNIARLRAGTERKIGEREKVPGDA